MKSISIILSMVLLASCASTDTSNSNNVKQSEIWQNYWVEYNEAGQVTAGATFRFGGSTGTTLLLTEPSKVLFDETELDHSSGVLIQGVIGGTHYSYEGNIGYKPEYSFEYTNNEGKTFVNKIGTAKIVADKIPEILDAAKDNYFQFINAPVAEGDNLMVNITNDYTGNSFAVEPVIKGNTVKINGTALSDLGNGPVTIIFRKTKNSNLQQSSGLGGQISITYVSKGFKSKVVNAKNPTKTDTASKKVQTTDTIKQ